jgi:hypothetical protein
MRRKCFKETKETMFLKRQAKRSSMVFPNKMFPLTNGGKIFAAVELPQDGMAPQKPGCPGNHNGTTGFEMSGSPC